MKLPGFASVVTTMDHKSQATKKMSKPVTTMATKSKRAKVVGQSSSSCDDLQSVVVRLQSELEVEQKSSRQLRREKALEVQQVREAEQSRAAASQKELASKLHLEKQKELEVQREMLRCKHEADIIKAIKQKDKEIKKLQKDLSRCQDELKEEIAKRGLSTSARGAFESERAKLLQEIKELTSAKKQLEDNLRKAAETEKQKNLEIRQLQETCKLEVAKVEKEAGLEVRKLLEELKAKDHLLAQLDRNQCPDRSIALRQHLGNQSVDELLSLSKEVESWESKSKQDQASVSPSPVTTTTIQNITWQKKIYELEKQIKLASGLNHAFVEKNKEITTINNSLEDKMKEMADENKELNSELTSAKTKMKEMNELLATTTLESLTAQLERLRKQIKEQEQVITQLRRECQEKDSQLKLKRMPQLTEKPKKAVRFLLPGETVPLAPGFDIEDVLPDNRPGDEHYGDDNADSMSIDSTLSDITCQSSQPSSDMNLTDDEQEFLEPVLLLENVEKDYEQLMREHLALEQSYASLVHSQSVKTDGEPPPEEWKIERESLNLAIWALEQKVRKCEETEDLLRMKLRQVNEEKEELEFKVLEHEECSEKSLGQEEEEELLEENEQLRSQVLQLQLKLERYDVKVNERHVGLQCNRLSPIGCDTAIIINEAESTHDKLNVSRSSALDLSVENLSRLGVSMEDSGCDLMLSSSMTESSDFDETSSDVSEISNLSMEIVKLVENCKTIGEPNVKPVPTDVRDVETKPVAKASTILLKDEVVNQQSSEAAAEAEVLVSEESETLKKVKKMEEAIKNFQQLEASWKTTVDKLERQLHQSVSREQIIRDQLVLLEEEKNRRINALQGQIDILEDNETRLSETILALEEMALRMESIESKVKVEYKETEDEELDKKEQKLAEELQLLQEAQNDLNQAKVQSLGQFIGTDSKELCRSSVEKDQNDSRKKIFGLADATQETIRKSAGHLVHTEQMVAEEARKERALGKQIKELEEEEWNSQTIGSDEKELVLNPLSLSNVGKERVTLENVCTFSVGELQTDLKELRNLLIRLKAVIDCDEIRRKSNSEKCDEAPSVMTSVGDGNKEVRAKLHLDTSVEMPPRSEDWLAITPPGFKMSNKLQEGDMNQDATEFLLRQKLDELEKDCERLQSLVHEEEQVIRDLHYQNMELRQSEKNFRELVEKMETTEEQMQDRLEEMAEETEILQSRTKELETKERMARTQLTKHLEIEADLEERLEQVMEEMQVGKQKMERKLSDAEQDKRNHVKKIEELNDRIGDLEGINGCLKQRIRNFEMVEANLRSQMRMLEEEVCSAGGQLSELEQQKEGLIQRLQDLEKEKSNLLFEIADLTMDSNKQGQRITVLNQEIGKLRGSLINKDEVIACLQGKLEETSSNLERLRQRTDEYESHKISLLEETNVLEANVRERNQRIRELEKELDQRQNDKFTNCCHRSTQTFSYPIKATIVIEKATSALKEFLVTLSNLHPDILREFLYTCLLKSLTSDKELVDTETVTEDTAITEEDMKRFVSSLKIDIPRDVNIDSTHHSISNGHSKGHSKIIHKKEEDEQWCTVEDPHVIHDVRAAENSSYWKAIESQMGVNADDLVVTLVFGDSSESEKLERIPLKDDRNVTQLPSRNLPFIDHTLIPPPLPTSSPPPLSPEPCPVEGRREDAEESADEASEIHDEDDGALPVGSNVTGSVWTDPYTRVLNQLPIRHWPVRGPSPVPVLPSEDRFLRAQSVDRDCVFKSMNQGVYGSSHLCRTATGSTESITDSGLDSMKQGTTFQDSAKQRKSQNSFDIGTQNMDQCTQTNNEYHEFHIGYGPMIVLKTTLEQRDKELSAKSNEVDRISQELRRWQQEATAASEEKARLSALLESALKDIKIMQGGDFRSPVTTKPSRSPLGVGICVSNMDRSRPSSLIPVSVSRHSSSPLERDQSTKHRELPFPLANRRPTSLHSELSRSSSSSTDGAPGSDPSSTYTSPCPDRRTESHLPRLIKDYSPTFLPFSSNVSSRKEADRLFKQSFDFLRNSPLYESASPPSQTGSEAVADATLCPLQAVVVATSSSMGTNQQ